jgi:hypothetical protein
MIRTWLNHFWTQLPRRWQVRFGMGIAGVMLRAIDFSLNRFGYQRTCVWLLRWSPTPPPDRVDQPRANAVAAIMLRAANRHQPPLNCVRHSLAIWWMLRWLRLPSQLRMGINLNEGHAWVEHHRQALNDTLDVAQRFAVLYDDRLTPEVIGKRG